MIAVASSSIPHFQTRCPGCLRYRPHHRRPDARAGVALGPIAGQAGTQLRGDTRTSSIPIRKSPRLGRPRRKPKRPVSLIGPSGKFSVHRQQPGQSQPAQPMASIKSSPTPRPIACSAHALGPDAETPDRGGGNRHGIQRLVEDIAPHLPCPSDVEQGGTRKQHWPKRGRWFDL